MKLLFSVPLVLWITSLAWGYPSFKEKIPNGFNVPHPCRENVMWVTVGHQSHDRGDDTNPFGADFYLRNFTWTEELCRKDSDGDGKTNGEELGDPECKWKKGMASPDPENDMITHPGICEPVYSPLCQGKNPFLICDKDYSLKDCNAINEAEVMVKELRLPVTQVPKKEKTYMCMTFELPDDQDYHIVAFEPIVDNIDVIHHMVVYQCSSGSQLYMPEPDSCEMPENSNSCYGMMTVWSAGVAGRCYGDNSLGFRMGTTGTRRIRLEVHWKNPGLKEDYTDSSGIRLHYRPVKDTVLELGVIATGQKLIEIPPGLPEFNLTANCQSHCTRKMITGPVYVVDVLNRMHSLGKSMRVSVYRGGKWTMDLRHDEHYHSEDPTIQEHRPPVVLYPGDEIRTSCVYDSMATKRWLYHGEAASGEMCYAFLLVYPQKNLADDGWCTSEGPLSSCDKDDGRMMGDCDWMAFTDRSHQSNTLITHHLERNCNTDGFCRPECKELTENVRKHPCLQGLTGQVVRSMLGKTFGGSRFLALLNSCSRGKHPRQSSFSFPPVDDSPPKNCAKDCQRICYDFTDSQGNVGGGAEIPRHVTWCLIFIMAAVTVRFF